MTTDTDKPKGVRFDMPFADYHAVQAVSASGLRLFARSAWHYRNRVEIVPTRPMLRGTLAHCALLEPDAMGARYAVVPDDAPRRPTKAQWNAKNPSPESVMAMQWWTAWQQSVGEREIITADDYALCQQQLRAINSVPEIAAYLAAGHGEVSIFWTDPATNLYCKARIDWLHLCGQTASVLELKSTADESPSGFGRTAARMRYELQRAHYIAAIDHGTEYTFGEFAFAAVSSAAPVLAVAYELTDELIAQANDDRADIMERMAWSMANDEWPAYGDGIQRLDYPAYAKRSGEVEVAFAEE